MNRLIALAVGLALAGVTFEVLEAQTPPAQPAPAPAAASTTQVVTPCDGVDEPMCGKTAGCVWLQGYKVPNAPDVPGYCRPAPKPITARRGPGAAASGQSSPQATPPAKN